MGKKVEVILRPPNIRKYVGKMEIKDNIILFPI